MGVIQGTITDQNTGKPVPGASIIVVDGSGNATGVSTVSDASGNFYLSDPSLDNAANQVEFNSPGYQTYIVGTTYANNNVALAPSGLISITTAAGPVTPVVSAAGVVTNLPAGNSTTSFTTPKPVVPIKPPVAATNYTWLWVSLLGIGLAVGGYFLFKNKGTAGSAAPAAAN